MLWNRDRHLEPDRGDCDDPAGPVSARLHTALDQVKFGVVLLDADLRAQFINLAFRRMWRLPDSKADGNPPFVALMYHGRDTRAYDVPEAQLDAYVAERVAHIKSHNPAPHLLRLANGEVIRLECAVLPDGGRLLSYTYVTDIVMRSDALEVLRAALDDVGEGVVLLDAQFNAQFMNRAVRRLWNVPDAKADRKPPFAELVHEAHRTGACVVPLDQIDAAISRRIAMVRNGDATSIDQRTRDGRIIRSRCTVLPDGGRMLTYTDITDLVHNAEELERLATTDDMTGLYNRRHFLALAEAEWNRFQRYHRPLSILVFDIDRFKAINDAFGHDVGDRAMRHVCRLCEEYKRSSDVLGRVGGDEFAMLLPETDGEQAEAVAERLRGMVEHSPLTIDDAAIVVSLSIGIAQATLSHAAFDVLMKLADRALYQAKAQGRNCFVRATALQPIEHRSAAE